jgi:hypothetical protein
MGLTKITSQNLSSGIDPILLGSGTVDLSKLDYLKNVTSDIQNQIDSIGGGPGGGDGNLASYTGGIGFLNYTSTGIYEARPLNSGDINFQIDANFIGNGSINNIQFHSLSGISSNIQTQLNSGVKTNDTRLSTDLLQYERSLRSPFTGFANAVTTNNQAYFVFLGQKPQEKRIKYVEFTINTSGRGTQTAEVGLFSTSLPPCKSGLIFTKLTYSDGITDMLGGSPKICRNVTGFVGGSGYNVPSGIYLWAGYRVSMVTTQPNVRQISAVDIGQGFVQIQANAPRFSGNIAGWSGTIQAASVTTLGPYLAANMD